MSSHNALLTRTTAATGAATSQPDRTHGKTYVASEPELVFALRQPEAEALKQLTGDGEIKRR
jgi:hypothetical protein